MASSLSINTHTYRLTHTTAHTQVGRHQSGPVVMSFHLSFIFILQFHHSLASCTLSPCPYSLLSFSSSLMVFHHLSIAPLFCCSFKLIAFLSVCFSFISTLSRLVFLSPSGKLCLYFSRLFLQMSDSVSALRLLIHRERKWWGESGRERGGKAATRHEVEREIQGEECEIWENSSSRSEKAGMRWKKERKSRTKSKKGRERASSILITLSLRSLSNLRLSPPFFHNSIPCCISPLLTACS